MQLKLHKNRFFVPKNHKNHPARPQASSVICLSYINLLSTGPKLDIFVQKKKTFCSSFLSTSKILVTLLVALAPAGRFFKPLYGPHTKRANKYCRAYTSLFSNMNTRLLKSRIICCRKISVFICKRSIYFSAPRYRQCPLTLFALETTLLMNQTLGVCVAAPTSSTLFGYCLPVFH